MTTYTAACVNCRFALPLPADDVPVKDLTCQIDPPSAPKRWPGVDDADWCGQHAAVPSTPQPGEPAHWAGIRAA